MTFLSMDDGALGAPLKADETGIPYIDWSLTSIHLYLRGLLTQEDIVNLVQEGVVSLEHIQIKEK